MTICNAFTSHPPFFSMYQQGHPWLTEDILPLQSRMALPGTAPPGAFSEREKLHHPP